MLRLRKILFYLCALLYLISCPLTILYALGYGVQPGAQRGLVKTGVISLATLPPGATVYIGRSRYTTPTPAVVRGLYPGQYPVRLFLKDYQGWGRTLTVHPEKATACERILLIPQVLRPRILISGPFTDLLPLAAGQGMVLSTGERVEDLLLYDGRGESSWPLLAEELPWGRDRIETIVTMPESESWLIKARGERGDRVLRVEGRGPKATLEEITELLPANAQAVIWDAADEHRLFALHDGGALDRVELGPRAIYPHIAEGLRGIGLARKSLYAVMEDGVVERLDHEGKHPQIVADDPRLLRGLAAAQPPIHVIVLRHLLLFVDGSGALFINRPPYRLVDANVRGVLVDASHRRVAVWQAGRIGVLETGPLPEDADGAAAPLAEVRWLASGADIQQAFWVYEASHLLIRDGDAIRLLEWEPDGEALAYELGRARRGSHIAYLDASGSCAYLDADTGGLHVLEILPRRERLAFPFREPSSTIPPASVPAGRP